MLKCGYIELYLAKHEANEGSCPGFQPPIPIRKLRGAVLVIAGLIPPATLQWRGAIQMAYQSQDMPKAKLAFWGMNCVPKSETRRQGAPS